MVKWKGGAVLIEAASRIVAKHPAAHFVFVGEGPFRRDWEELAHAKGLARNVTMTGRRDDTPEVYASLDLVVLPSFDEAMPMCLLEAMAAGVPVIATTVGGIPEIISDGRSGFLVPPGDAKALAAAILEVLEFPRRAADMARIAQANVLDKFSSEGMARNYTRLYEEAAIAA
jgi:glycosyltransferase involved in cell wall biosynthesis